MTTNVQIMKTKAEKAFAEHFASVAETLPNDAVKLDARRAAMVRFDELGLPHRRIEAWKYTDLRNALGVVDAPAVGEAPEVAAADLDAALGVLAELDTYRAVFVNGRQDESLSRLPSTSGVEIGPLAAASSLDEALADESIVALNTAFMTGGLAIKIADGVALDKPLMIISVRAGGSDMLVTTRHDVSVGAQSALTLIEAAVSIGETAGQANGLISIAVGDGGRLDQIKIGSASAVADLATWRVHLASEATYRAFQLTPGGAACAQSDVRDV